VDTINSSEQELEKGIGKIVRTISNKEVLVSFFVVFLVYWPIYLISNYQTRVYYSLGFSDFPFPPSRTMQMGLYGTTAIIPFYLLFALFLGTFILSLLNRYFRKQKKRKLSWLVLVSPLILLVPVFLAPCEELECLMKIYVFFTAIILIGLAWFLVLFLILIENFIGKFRILFYLFLFVFILSLIVPVFAVSKLNSSFKSRIVSESPVKITDYSFQKIQITENEFGEIANKAYTQLEDWKVEKRSTGEVVLGKIDENRFLIQEVVQKVPKGDSNWESIAELFVEENGNLKNITKGLSFYAVYDSSKNPKIEDLSLSPKKDIITFIQGQTLYVVNLDGSGVLVDKSFCPSFCITNIGLDNTIYSWATINGANYPKMTYWKSFLP